MGEESVLAVWRSGPCIPGTGTDTYVWSKPDADSVEILDAHVDTRMRRFR